MPKNVCFYVCERAGTDISLKDEKQSETSKNEHESRTCADQSKKSQFWALEDHIDLRFIRFSPWSKFQRLSESVPQVSEVVIYGPLKTSLLKRQLWSFENQKIT